MKFLNISKWNTLSCISIRYGIFVPWLNILKLGDASKCFWCKKIGCLGGATLVSSYLPNFREDRCTFSDLRPKKNPKYELTLPKPFAKQYPLCEFHENGYHVSGQFVLSNCSTFDAYRTVNGWKVKNQNEKKTNADTLYARCGPSKMLGDLAPKVSGYKEFRSSWRDSLPADCPHGIRRLWAFMTQAHIMVYTFRLAAHTQS